MSRTTAPAHGTAACLRARGSPATSITPVFAVSRSITGCVSAGLRTVTLCPRAFRSSIVFSLIGAGLAVLNLVLDFDYIEQGVAMGAPASESWRGAFGLTVTMVWLYIEILRLLSYLRR